MGEHALSLEAIDLGRLGIERLICYVDFAMVLNVEFDGQPENVQVSLVEQPKRYETQLIDAYLAEHGDEMSIRHLRCPDCGYLTINSRETTCQNCDSPLEAIRDTSEMWLRDSARKRLMWEAPGFQAVSSVPGDLVSQVHPSGATMLSDLLLPLSTVFQQLLVSMGHTKSRYVRECWSHLCLGTSVREMLPCGDTIEQKHRHYLVVREKLTSGYNMLTGLALQYPEFKDGYDVAGLRRFPPPVTPDRRAVFGPDMPPVAQAPSQDVLPETALSNIGANPATGGDDTETLKPDGAQYLGITLRDREALRIVDGREHVIEFGNKAKPWDLFKVLIEAGEDGIHRRDLVDLMGGSLDKHKATLLGLIEPLKLDIDLSNGIWTLTSM